MSKKATALVDDSRLDPAASLDAETVRMLRGLRLSDAAKRRVEFLAEQANEGRLTPDEASEYDRYIELCEVISTFRLRAERHVASAKTR